MMDTGFAKSVNVQMSLFSAGASKLAARLERVEELDELYIGVGAVVGLQQQADGGYGGIGVSRSGIVGQEKPWLEPGFVLGRARVHRSAGAAGGVVGARRLGASLTRVQRSVCGVRV